MRRPLFALFAFLLGAAPAAARDVVDSAGRRVAVPDVVTRVFAAGPPASVLLYALAPQMMMGWQRAPRAAEKPFLLPNVRDLPELGRLTGRGDTLSLERLIADKPDLVVDFGSINDTYRSLADRVQAQTGIPYLLIDGRFENTASALRLLANVLGVSSRGEGLARAAEAAFAHVDATLAQVPAAERPRVYLARGAAGLESGSRGSINTEIIERVGAINVVEGLREQGGLVTVSPEQVLAWGPQAIIALDPAFPNAAAQDPIWRGTPAFADGRVFLAPSLPFGFVDSPPSLNRLVGLDWLLAKLYPARAAFTRDDARLFYNLFYQVDPTDADLDRALAGARD